MIATVTTKPQCIYECVVHNRNLMAFIDYRKYQMSWERKHFNSSFEKKLPFDYYYTENHIYCIIYFAMNSVHDQYEPFEH